MPEDALVSAYADDPIMKPIIEQFVAGLPESINKMRQAVAQEDFDLIRRLGHQMKGAGGGYGFAEISAAGQRVEVAVDKERLFTPEVQESIDGFIETLRRASPAVVGSES